MDKIKNIALIAFATYLLPAVTFAQTGPPDPIGGANPFGNTILAIEKLVGRLIPLLTAIALVFFLWHLVKVIRDPSNEDSRKGILWGIIALFVLVSVWGIVRFVGKSLGIDENTSVNPPKYPGGTAGSGSSGGGTPGGGS